MVEECLVWKIGCGVLGVVDWCDYRNYQRGRAEIWSDDSGECQERRGKPAESWILNILYGGLKFGSMLCINNDTQVKNNEYASICDPCQFQRIPKSRTCKV